MPAIQLRTLAALTGAAVPESVDPEYELKLWGERSAAPPKAGSISTGPQSGGEALDAHLNDRPQVEVDFNRCEGHGFCEQVAPEIFALDDAGELTLSRTELNSETIGKAIAAARTCPVAAIKVKNAGGEK